MSLIITITCDVCGTIKREANHWFSYLAQEGPQGQVTFYPWSEQDYRSHKHLCSERCSMTVLSRTLGTWSKSGDA